MNNFSNRTLTLFLLSHNSLAEVADNLVTQAVRLVPYHSSSLAVKSGVATKLVRLSPAITLSSLCQIDTPFKRCDFGHIVCVGLKAEFSFKAEFIQGQPLKA